MSTYLITVNYGNSNPTKDLIQSIENCYLNNNLKIFIADNQSTEKSKEELLIIKNSSFLDIELIFFEKNYFYWTAAEKVLTRNLKNSNPSWVIICNNDIIIKTKTFFNDLYKLDGKHYNVIGPKIINKERINLNPFMLKPLTTFRRFYWYVYFRSFYFSILLRFFSNIKGSMNLYKAQEEIKKVYAVHGSAIIFSNFFFKKGGKLDTGFKMFCEELTTAEISKKIGCEIFYYPKLELLHNEHTSTKNANSKDLFLFAKKSHHYFLNKYINK